MKGSEEDEEEKGDEKRESEGELLLIARTQTKCLLKHNPPGRGTGICARCRLKKRHTCVDRSLLCFTEQSGLLVVAHFVPQDSSASIFGFAAVKLWPLLLITDLKPTPNPQPLPSSDVHPH